MSGHEGKKDRAIVTTLGKLLSDTENCEGQTAGCGVGLDVALRHNRGVLARDQGFEIPQRGIDENKNVASPILAFQGEGNRSGYTGLDLLELGIVLEEILQRSCRFETAEPDAAGISMTHANVLGIAVTGQGNGGGPYAP